MSTPASPLPADRPFDRSASPPRGRARSAIVFGLVLVGIATACQPVATVPKSTTPTTTRPPAASTTVPATVGSTTAPVPSTTTTALSPQGWSLVGGDEFDDSTVDASKWKPYFNNYGSANAELECNTPSNVTEGGGSLKIVAKKQAVSCPTGGAMDYTSGFLGSREVGRYYPKYARFEMRAKLPHAQGLWPAFWLRHRNGAGIAEVDIMEYFHSQVPGKTSQTLHLDGVSNLSKKATAFEAPSVGAPAWHTWAVEIARDPAGVRFTFSLDGATTHTFVDTKHAWAASADEASTWDIALNLAVGGRWVGRPGDTKGYLRDLDRCAIGGTAPAGCTATGINHVDWSKSTYEIDYVRVFTRP